MAPLAVAYPFGLVVLMLAQGTERLHVYSWSALAGRVALLLSVVILTTLGDGLAPTSVVVIDALTLALGWSIAIAWLKPVTHRVGEHAKQFLRSAREYGFGVYVGRVLSVGTYNVDVLMVGVAADARSVAHYSLAKGIASLVSLPSLGLAGALFARMTVEQTLSRGLRWTVAATGAAAAVVAALLAGPAIQLVFGAGYQGAAALVLPLALAEATRGITTLYNGFLSAHGRGRELRNAGLVLTVSNLVLNLALIPPYGASGAAWASLVALLLNLAAHIWGYRRALSGDGGPPGSEPSQRAISR